MDYDKIINSAYDWISLDKLIWFLFFFWLSLPVFLLVPIGIEKGFFYSGLFWLVDILYYIMYFAILLALMLLTTGCLNKKNFKTHAISISKFGDTIFLVFLELWYVFVWNIHKSYRFTQLLLLIGLPLLAFYNLTVVSPIIIFAFWVFIISYGFIVLYNAMRLSFSISIFYSEEISIKNAIKKSWHLTHKKFLKIFAGYIFAISSALVLFVVLSSILSLISSLFLLQQYTWAIAYKLSLLIGTLLAAPPALLSYYFSFAEIFYQINNYHKSNTIIKNILSRKVLSKKPSKKKKVKTKSKKKKVKKKLIKKKVKKKKYTKKK